jgi:uncharacterized membrane protein (DUF106 family)
MVAIVHALNRVMTVGFDLLLRPLHFLGPFWSLTLISFLTGVLMVWIFGRVSDQKAIKQVRGRISGNLIAVRLFQNDIRVFLSVQGRILRDTLTYMRHSLTPMLVLMGPVVLIIIQLHLHYHSRPMDEGEKTLVTVRMSADRLQGARAGIALEAPEGIEIETPGVWIPSKGEMSWRVRAEQAGTHTLVVQSGDESVTKELVVGSGWGGVSSLRSGDRLLDLLLYPKEPPVDPASGIASIEVIYPDLEIRCLGIGVDWLIAFFVLSIAFGFAVKGFLGVEV